MADMETRGWQPIETAPRDGTEILVWCPVYWRGALQRHQITVAVYNAWGWSLAHTGGYAEDADLDADPAKWQPLPIPPDDTGGG